MEAGVKVGLRFTMTNRNAGDIADIFSLVRSENIPRVCFYHLVYTGRAAQLMTEDLDRAATRRAVDLIIDRTAELHARGRPTEVLTVDNHADGPYLYLRMLREGAGRAGEVLELLRAGGGNGAVYADQFWRSVRFGNVTERKFSQIWTDLSNPLMARLKHKYPHVKGRCAACRFLSLCGGNLRARAEAATGDAWAADPACYLTDEEITTPATSQTGEDI